MFGISINSFAEITKEDKALYLNIGANVTLIAYGMQNWRYDFLGTKPHAVSEGWFDKDTEHGGADKFGHAYVGHVLSHAYASSFKAWGYSHDEAALLGFYSSLIYTTTMEIGDSFSKYGFSHEDMVANFLGASFGYYSFKYPSFAKKFDYRVEYKMNKNSNFGGFVTDYENIKYILAVKAEGFTKNPYLEYLELYFGYNVRGYEEAPFIKKREKFVGAGINFAKLFNFKLFNYYQIRKSYPTTNSLD